MTENFGFGKRFIAETAKTAEEMAKLEEIRANTEKVLTKVICQYDLGEYLSDNLVLNETLKGLSSRRFSFLVGNLLDAIDDITKIARATGQNLYTAYVSKLHSIYNKGFNIDSLKDYDTEKDELYEYLSEFSVEAADAFDEFDFDQTINAFRSLLYLAFIVEYQNISEAVKSTKDSDDAIKDS